MKILDERDVAHKGAAAQSSFRADLIRESAEFRKFYEQAPNVVAVDQMPFERSPDGLIRCTTHFDLTCCTSSSCLTASREN